MTKMKIKLAIIISLIIIFSNCINDTSISYFSTTHKTTIGIQPFEGFNQPLTDTVANTLKKAYGFKVVVLPEIKIPKKAYVNTKSPRYRADTLLRHLRRNKPDSIDFILGLTHKDISTTKRDKNGHIKKPEYKYKDWGIFGLGYCPGPSCIISTFRLKKTTKSNFIQRFKKVVVHELGHNLGLPHCETITCVMEDAKETIKTVDKGKLTVCDSCKLILSDRGF